MTPTMVDKAAAQAHLGQHPVGEESVWLTVFKRMLRIRRCEEALITAYHPADLMRCPTHFCVGQESIPAVLSLSLQPQDLLFCHHRNHGYFLAKGGTMRRLFAELHGKATGSNKGLAGSQDISEGSLGFYSGAIVSGTASIATGAAFATKFTRGEEIVVAVFGDGAMDQGVMWECFNMAALKQLPILFLCENNMYSTYSPVPARHAVPDFVTKVASFGISSRRLTTEALEPLVTELGRSVATVRTNRLPAFLEIRTYRFCPHVGPESDDDIGYRTAEELEYWKARDPLEGLRRTLVPSLLSQEALRVIEAEISKEIHDAFEFAQHSPFPDTAVMFEALLGDGQQPHGVSEHTSPARGVFNPIQPEAKLQPY